jgi:hypothetical protein
LLVFGDSVVGRRAELAAPVRVDGIARFCDVRSRRR